MNHEEWMLTSLKASLPLGLDGETQNQKLKGQTAPLTLLFQKAQSHNDWTDRKLTIHAIHIPFHPRPRDRSPDITSNR